MRKLRRGEVEVTAATMVELDGEEVEVEATGVYTPSTPDVYYLRNGDPGYPGDPAEVEIFTATRTDNGQDVLARLTEKYIGLLNECLAEKASDAGYDYDGDEVDREIDRLKEQDY